MSNNPYQAPRATVDDQTPLPDNFIHGKLTWKKLNAAAWIAIFYLVFSIPLLGISYYAEIEQDKTLHTIENIASLVSLALYIYLILIFRSFLETRFANVNFATITYLSIAATSITVLIPILFTEPATDDVVQYLLYLVALLVPTGIVTLIYGIKLIRINHVYPYLKPLGWLNIITGVLMITIILFLLVIPLGFASEILMILIFFSASRELRSSTV